ncbi:uncharacterized protein [Primulina eburnea]|uniref:uncharacterized protein isoform X2 n=1 Tax=Primulina eburnea TaxID=1245227 RepID=UPI003C6C10E2
MMLIEDTSKSNFCPNPFVQIFARAHSQGKSSDGLDCEVVEISDDEDSLVPDNDVGIEPKNEVLDYDSPLPKICPQHGGGERNTELLLETLFAYSALHKPESPDSLDSFLTRIQKSCLGLFH